MLRSVHARVDPTRPRACHPHKQQGVWNGAPREMSILCLLRDSLSVRASGVSGNISRALMPEKVICERGGFWADTGRRHNLT